MRTRQAEIRPKFPGADPRTPGRPHLRRSGRCAPITAYGRDALGLHIPGDNPRTPGRPSTGRPRPHPRRSGRRAPITAYGRDALGKWTWRARST